MEAPRELIFAQNENYVEPGAEDRQILFVFLQMGFGVFGRDQTIRQEVSYGLSRAFQVVSPSRFTFSSAVLSTEVRPRRASPKGRREGFDEVQIRGGRPHRSEASEFNRCALCLAQLSGVFLCWMSVPSLVPQLLGFSLCSGFPRQSFLYLGVLVRCCHRQVRSISKTAGWLC